MLHRCSDVRSQQPRQNQHDEPTMPEAHETTTHPTEVGTKTAGGVVHVVHDIDVTKCWMPQLRVPASNEKGGGGVKLMNAIVGNMRKHVSPRVAEKDNLMNRQLGAQTPGCVWRHDLTMIDIQPREVAT